MSAAALVALGTSEQIFGMADLKLLVPFVTAILLVWIKGWIEERLDRGRKQRALWRLLVVELTSTVDTEAAFRAIGASAQEGRTRLVTLATPDLLSKISGELAELDPSNAYLYSDLDVWVSIVSAGLARLASLQAMRITAAADVVGKVDRVIFGQARITASDAMSMASAAIAVLEIIPERHRLGFDPVHTFPALRNAVLTAREALAAWPTFELNPVRAATPVAVAVTVSPSQPPLLPKVLPGDEDYLDGGG